MSTKSNTFPLLQHFILYAEKQFDATVRIVRTDNGMEFQDSSALLFYAKKGILHQKSCVDTPQQNGIVERKQQHLLEVARALMFQANVPSKFWGESILTATYLINRFPTPILDHKTPYELLYKEKPTYSHLRMFGCLCYASSLKRDRSKFSPRAVACLFLGYPYGQKAYKLYDMETKKIFISRDVVFHENYFPYAAHKHQSHLPLPLPINNEDVLHTSSSIQHTLAGDLVHTSNTPINPSATLLQPSEVPSSPVQTQPISQPATHINPSSSVQQNVLPIRKSTRSHKSPTHYQDYICSNIQTNCCNMVALNSDHIACLSALEEFPEPSSYEVAARHPGWIEAINKEIIALQTNNTWEVVDLPLIRKLLVVNGFIKLS